MKEYSIFFKSILVFTLLGNSAQAQTLFSTSEYLDINQIKASHLVHGDMWYDMDTSKAGMEYPKGSKKKVNTFGGLWLSALDNGGNIRVAASLFRNNADFMPGPLDAADTIEYATSEQWARIWKINYSEIKTFLALSTKTTATIPASILEWPAKGNIYAKGNAGASLSIGTDMAPFVDVDADGIYNPLNGDYPQMKGDQMLWWIINDNGREHTTSKGAALKVEVHIAAYAYQRYSAVDRMIFYEYTVHNKSDQNYTNFRLANWSECDLGNGYDDFIGIDSNHRMSVIFNGTEGGIYEKNPPLTGLSIVDMPGDICGGSKIALGSITTFEIGISGALRHPSNSIEFANYMNSKFPDGSPMSLKWGPVLNLIYNINSTSNICDSMRLDPLKVRRSALSTSGFDLPANSSKKVVLAFMFTDTNAHLCPSLKMNEISDLADTAWKVYCNPLPLKTSELSIQKNKLSLYPNPAQTILYVSTGKNTTANENLRVIDALGKTIQVPMVKNADKFEVNINSLAADVYSILFYDGEQTSATSFVKN